MSAESQSRCAWRLTPAERQMRYKEKIRRDPQKYEEYKSKKREAYHAKKRLVKDLTPEERERAREMWKLRKQKLRRNSKPAFAFPVLPNYTMLSAVSAQKRREDTAVSAQKRREELNAAPGPSAVHQEQEDSDSESWGTESELPVCVVPAPAAVPDPLGPRRCALCAATTSCHTDALHRPYSRHHRTRLALNHLSIDVHLPDTSTVCLGCHTKLLGILDFMKRVKDAQQLLNETETVVKTECESPVDEIDCKEEIVDSITIDPTVFVKHVKRRCEYDKPKAKRAKIPDNEMPDDNRLMKDIKVERFEMDEVNTNMFEASEDTWREDTAPDIGANEFVITSNALSNKRIGDGYS